MSNGARADEGAEWIEAYRAWRGGDDRRAKGAPRPLHFSIAMLGSATWRYQA